jgi:hypothetical protein
MVKRRQIGDQLLRMKTEKQLVTLAIDLAETTCRRHRPSHHTLLETRLNQGEIGTRTSYSRERPSHFQG